MRLSANDLARLLVDLGAAGVELALDPSDAARIRHRPRDLPETLAARLWLGKPALLRILRGEGVPNESDADSEGGYVMGERLGFADELGHPTHPGSPAWLIAVGEGMAANCRSASIAVDSPHGRDRRAADKGDRGLGPDPVRDQQGLGDQPVHAVPAGER